MPDHELTAAIRDLDAEARHHKREAARHRALARAARDRQARLVDECRRLGIHFTIHGAGDIHGQTRPRPLDPR